MLGPVSHLDGTSRSRNALPLIPAARCHGSQQFILGLVPAAEWALPPKERNLAVTPQFWMHDLLERAVSWFKDTAGDGSATYVGSIYDVHKCT